MAHEETFVQDNRKMIYDPVFDGFDDELLREQQNDELRAKKREDDSFRAQMSSREGRRFVWALLASSGVFWTTYNPKAKEISIDMAFAEGRKQLGYELLSKCMRVCPALYNTMFEESKEDERDAAG